jgi:hypothetical protein
MGFLLRMQVGTLQSPHDEGQRSEVLTRWTLLDERREHGWYLINQNYDFSPRPVGVTYVH